MQQNAYYDPTAESGNDEQVVATHWECLRRNARFREVARQWVHSKSFRFELVLTSDYHHPSIHFQRCALDWMLRPSERLDLAEFQISQGYWFKDDRFNFGPVVAKLRTPKELIVAKNLRDAFQVVAQPGTQCLRLEHNWRESSEAFKTQFRAAILEPQGLRNVTPIIREGATLTRVVAKYVAAGDPHNEKLVLARELMQFGDHLYDLGEEFVVFAFPRGATPGRLKAALAEVRRVFRDTGQLKQAAKYNLHKSYYGTREDWHWFLEAEARKLDSKKTSDLYKLAEIYSEHLKQTAPGKRRKNVQTAGFRGAKVESRLLRARRSTLRKHIQSIQRWIDQTYPPRPPSK